MVSLCEWHHLGYKAGRNWATSHRRVLREYLVGLYGPEPYMKGTNI